ncbi:MAG: phage tail protein [Clostridium beijerinckii]|jgi:phage protein U|nr:phage tail protein [Clostridium beijerinckii]MCI1578575.1 phage tail protein [Clostridium beijerinckii]MCI1582093.1 phage tail protein [Clostridium beijerinckii]MCI1621943.1 phage tail protein [Clostridium beijerinckii]
MSLGSFSSKVFEVSQNKIYTFDEYSREISLNAEDQDVDGDKPSTYIKGINLEQVSFNIKLIQSSSIDVEAEINDWKNICEAGDPYMLFIGDNPVSNNKYLLTGISLSDNSYTAKGKQNKSTLKLTFKEYVRAGVKKEEGTSSETKKSTKKASKKKSSSSSEPMSDEDNARVTELENSVFGDE